jgi:hypothetical protein
LSKRKTNYHQVRQVFACFSYNAPKKTFKTFDKKHEGLMAQILAALFKRFKGGKTLKAA